MTNRVNAYTGEFLIGVQEQTKDVGLDNSHYHDKIVLGTLALVGLATAVVIGSKRLDRFKNHEQFVKSLEHGQENLDQFNLHQ